MQNIFLHDPSVDADLSRRINTILVEFGWTARDLARAAGLRSESHVSTIMRSGGATTATLIKIAKAGRVRFEWLATGEGERRAEVSSVVSAKASSIRRR